MEKIITFGCRLNFYESEVIRKKLESENYDLSNVVIINSCAVTNEAERKVKQKIRKINAQDPNKKIIVIGCGVQLKPTDYATLPGVEKVIGNGEKLKTKHYQSNEKIIIGNVNEARGKNTINITHTSDRVRASIQIQDGCNHDCTFCAITIARGNNRSIPVDEIIHQAQILVENGYNEIVLTGVDITDYGKDLCGKPSFNILIKRILSSVPELTRLRLSSVDVAEIDEEMIDLIAYEQRLMPHIHISLQSGDNMILKRMKRRHSRENVIEFCCKISKKRKEVVFGADIIAGFPTETEQMFQNSVTLIKEANITYLHVFPYSSKDGTKAARMPQLSREIIKERSKMLIKLGDEQLKLFYSNAKNKVFNVIIERDDIGRAENFALVKVKSPNLIRNQICKVIIDGADGAYLTGNILIN